MRIADFDYDLPPDRIAQHPLDRRDASRLLVVDRTVKSWRDADFTDLPGLLNPGDLVVVNDTLVFPARLYAVRPTGGRVELLLTRPLGSDVPGQSAGFEWEAIVRPARKVSLGDTLSLLTRNGEPDATGSVTVLAESEGGRRAVRLKLAADPWQWISEHGHVPLPPYIDRADEDGDHERYQTVYARNRGAVAAPTAGLHFTVELLEGLRAAGVGTASLTLHVGPGTFRPVTAESVEDHTMDAEWFEIPAETAEALADARARGGRIIAVGTTTVRALESAAPAWVEGPCEMHGWGDLFIVPGHEFGWVDGLVTNFHLPRSTLLLLVSALAGTDLVRAAYRHAVESGYRFYSYGDAMLIL